MDKNIDHIIMMMMLADDSNTNLSREVRSPHNTNPIITSHHTSPNLPYHTFDPII
jgi:hypothetical protein